MQDDIGIASLPLEVLQRVFFYVQSPMLIGQVCHKWRLSSQNYPPLWDSLILTSQDDLSSSENIARFEKILAYWGGFLSSAHPFYLKVTLGRGFSSRDKFFFPTNIRELEILQGNLTDTTSLPTDTASLEYLQALKMVGSYRDSKRLFRILQVHLPKLQMLYIDIEGLNILKCEVPWTQLTHVCINKISPVVWRDFVRRCPHLVKCFVGLQGFEVALRLLIAHPDEDFGYPRIGMRDGLRPKVVILEDLKEFTLVFTSTIHDSAFLGLQCPALQKLHLENPGDDLIELSRHGQRFLRGVASHLTDLSLLDHLLYADDVLEILRLATQLVVLRIDLKGNHDNFLTALTINDPEDIHSPVLVPDLAFCNIIVTYSLDRQSLSAEPYSQAFLTRWNRWCAKTFADTGTLEGANESFHWDLAVGTDQADVLFKIRESVYQAQASGPQLSLKVQTPRRLLPFPEEEDIADLWTKNADEYWGGWKQELDFPDEWGCKL